MSWNDGISKELSEYFDSLSNLGEIAIESLKEQVDIESQNVLEELIKTTPEGQTGGLLRSLQKAKLTVEKSYYGYIVTFSGENKNGTTYEKIANILNYGSSTIKPLKFVSKVVKKLKGLDNCAAERFDKKSDDIGD